MADSDAQFQSTHPLGVRLSAACHSPWQRKVSIHAPTRGATQFSHLSCLPHEVSIHAPTRGATYLLAVLRHRKQVSIHAPTRGATVLAWAAPTIPYCFNPRTHSGCDSGQLEYAKSAKKFQSTHPLGVRQWCAARQTRSIGFQSTHPLGVRLVLAQCFLSLTGFNPRTHSGCDQSVTTVFHVQTVSIHAPTRGATVLRIWRG